MTASWDDIKKRKPEKVIAGDFEVLAMQTFASIPGKLFLSLLRKKYIEHVLSGMPDDRALVMHEAKRQLVRDIENAIERAQSAAKPDSK